MKKILLTILFLVSFAVAGNQIKMTEACQIRNTSDWRTSTNVGVIQSNETTTVLETYGDWVQVEVVSGSDHAGKTGYMWSKRVGDSNVGTSVVIIEGCTLRSSPEKVSDNTPADTADDTNFVAKVRKGAVLKIIKVVPTWYRIGPNKWVSAKYTISL